MTRKKCSRCGDPVKGHKGPAGPRCQNVDDPDQPPTPSSPPAPKKPKDKGDGGKTPPGGPAGPGKPGGVDGDGTGDEETGKQNPHTEPVDPPEPIVTPLPQPITGQVPAAPGQVPDGRPGLVPVHVYGAEPQGGPYGAFGGHHPYGYVAGGAYSGGPWLPGAAGPFPSSSFRHQGAGWSYYGQQVPQASYYGPAGPRVAVPSTGGLGFAGAVRPQSAPVDWSDVAAAMTTCGSMLSGKEPNTDQASMTVKLKQCLDKLNNAMNTICPDQPQSNAWQPYDNNMNSGPTLPPSSQYHPHYATSNTQASAPHGMDPMYGFHQQRHGRNPYQPGSMPHKLKAQGVPTKTIDAALEGEFIDLADFLPPIGASNNVSNPDLECFIDTDSKAVSYRPKKHSRKITSHDTWSQAWVPYEKLLVSHFGQAVHEYLADYRANILDYSKKYMWQAVAVYDFRHRSRLASQVTLSERLNFSIIFNDISNTILDTTAVRQNATRCQRCKAYDHVVRDCPFPEGWRGGQGTNQGKSQAKVETQEVCYNFNKEKCNSERCKRRHVCRYCKGPLPYTKCSVSGSCSSKGSVPT